MLQKGTIVYVPFPFKEVSGGKMRPAVVLATPNADEIVLCMVTSVEQTDSWVLPLTTGDLASGKMPYAACFIRPNRLFTGDPAYAKSVIGELGPLKIRELSQKLATLLAL